MKEPAPALKFPVIQYILVDFFEFLSADFAACQSRQEEIIIVKRFIYGRNNMTKVRVKSRSCNQGRRKNSAFTLSSMLSTNLFASVYTQFIYAAKKYHLFRIVRCDALQEM